MPTLFNQSAIFNFNPKFIKPADELYLINIKSQTFDFDRSIWERRWTLSLFYHFSMHKIDVSMIPYYKDVLPPDPLVENIPPPPPHLPPSYRILNCAFPSSLKTISSTIISYDTSSPIFFLIIYSFIHAELCNPCLHFCVCC